MDMLNHCRTQLMRLMRWRIGFQTDFTVSIRKSGKYMYKWLEEEKWTTFLKTYPSGEIKDIWESVFIMCDLFNDIARDVSHSMNVKYNEIEANNSLKFLKDVQLLPKDAKQIY